MSLNTMPKETVTTMIRAADQALIGWLCVFACACTIQPGAPETIDVQFPLESDQWSENGDVVGTRQIDRVPDTWLGEESVSANFPCDELKLWQTGTTYVVTAKVTLTIRGTHCDLGATPGTIHVRVKDAI